MTTAPTGRYYPHNPRRANADRWLIPDDHCYCVRYFDESRSRKGQGGTRLRSFATETEAQDFARGKKVYARPAIVEFVPLSTEAAE